MTGFCCPHVENDEEEKSNVKEFINSDDKVSPHSFFSPEAKSLKSIGIECHLDSNGLNDKDDSLHSKVCNQKIKESVICDDGAISYLSFGTCVGSKLTYAKDKDLSYSEGSFYNVNVEMK